MTFDEMIAEITSDLTTEISAEDPDNFNPELLTVKINGAVRAVKGARRYPASYTEEKIEADLVRFHSQIIEIARYDYNQIGSEGQTSYNADGVTINYVDRKSLFRGITPLAVTT